MKTIFSAKHGDRYTCFIGIDESKNEVQELKKLREMIELELYYRLDKIVTLTFQEKCKK